MIYSERTVNYVTKALISVEMNPFNKDTPVLRTEFSSPISVLIRGVSLYILSCLDQFPIVLLWMQLEPKTEFVM